MSQRAARVTLYHIWYENYFVAYQSAVHSVRLVDGIATITSGNFALLCMHTGDIMD